MNALVPLVLCKRELGNMNLSAEQRVYQRPCSIPGTENFISRKLLPEKLLINYILLIVFNGILIIPTILLNAVPLIMIWKSSQLSRKPCYFIILVQSAIDLAVGIVSIPLSILHLRSTLGGDANYCSIAFLTLRLTRLPLGLSTIILTALTLERYIAIVHPYSYNTKVTKKRLLAFIGSCFVAEFSVFMLSLQIEWLIKIYAIVKRTLVFLFIVFAYTRIYFVVRQISRTQCKSEDPSSGENLTRMKLFAQEIKQAKACFIVVICFCVLTFLPVIIAIPLFPMFDKFDELSVKSWVTALALFHSSANSVIFFWTKTMLRKEALKILKRTMS